jgi:hypothetical protein
MKIRFVVALAALRVARLETRPLSITMETQAVRQVPDQTTIRSTKPPEPYASKIYAI